MSICKNILRVKGHPRRVVEFILENFRVRKENSIDMFSLSFENITPTPKGKTGEITDDHKRWRRMNWDVAEDLIPLSQTFNCRLKDGTDLNISDRELTPSVFMDNVDNMDVNADAEVTIWFNTDCCCPYAWYHMLFKMHEGDDLEFKYEYYNTLDLFAGEAIIKNDNVLDAFNVEVDDSVRFYKYILDKGYKTPDMLFDDIESVYHNAYKHLGSEFVDKMTDSTRNAIMNVTENRNEALARVYDKLVNM